MMTKTIFFPSQRVVDFLDVKKTFQKKVTAWEHSHYVTSPSELVEGGIDEIGYYEAIILSIFASLEENEDYLLDCANKVTAESNQVFSNMKSFIDEIEGLEKDALPKNQILSTMEPETYKKVKEFLTSEFKERHPSLDVSETLSSEISTIFEVATTLGEAIELMSSYIAMSELSVEMKAVLLEMEKQCPKENIALKSALKDVAKSMEGLSGAIAATISSAGKEQGGNVLGVCLDEVWKLAVNQNPYAKAFSIGASAGTWIGTGICNGLFSTDETIEQYKKMKCLGEVTELIRDTVQIMENTYLSNKTTQNAGNYFAAVDALFSASDLSCKFALKYAEILYEDAGLGWLVIKEQSYEEYVSSVKSINKNCNDQKESLTINYLTQLEGTYPEIYEFLMAREEEEEISVTEICFEEEEITIGLEDDMIGLENGYFLLFGKPTIFPSNANNQKVTYTSSDTSILEVDKEFGLCKLISAGTVVVTATAEDSGVTDTVTVNVIERSSGIGSAVEVSNAVTYGTCGENIEWVLYDNGKLVISGTGEMECEEGLYWKEYKDKIEEVYIMEGVATIDNYVYIGEGAFSECSSLMKIILPESLTHIGNYAFVGCNSLTEIILPEGLSSIETYTFYACSSLTKITLPKSLINIGTNAFLECSSLTEIILPKGLSSIGIYAFSGCSSLTEIILPEGLSDIEAGTFSKCSSLTEITLPKSLINIGSSAFSECNSLTEIILPEGLNNIEEWAFYKCSSLTEIILPEGLSSIGEMTFYNCSSLMKIILPESLTHIGSYAFVGCNSLTEITLPESLTYIGSDAFSGCSSLTEVTLPESLTYIGSDAFSMCSSLTKIVLPKGLSSIDWRTFSGCSSLTEIILPESLSYIGSDAFDNCPNLTIKGVANSYAETYAKENNIPFIEISAKDENDTIIPELSDIDAYLYNAEYYMMANEDVAVALQYDEEKALEHWLNVGIAEGRNASVIFNAAYYLETNPKVAELVGTDYKAAYEHFVNTGIENGLEASPVFNVQYYLQVNTDVAQSCNNDYILAIAHFAQSGMMEGRSGSANFDYTVYMDCNRDVAELYGDDIRGYYIHYINHGRAEGRTAGLGNSSSNDSNNTIDVNSVSYRIFDKDFYLENHKELAQTIGTTEQELYLYWINTGISLGHIASPIFNPIEYLNINTDVAEAFGNDVVTATNHFFTQGIYEGRTGTREFDYTVYKYCNTDVVDVFGEDIVGYYFHYVKYGRDENRTAKLN